MPLDPRIPLMAQAPLSENPMDRRAKMMQLSDAVQSQQMRQFIFAQQQREQAKQEAIAQALRAHPEDLAAALPDVKKIDPYYGWALQNQITNSENSDADDRRKRMLDQEKDQERRLTNVVGLLYSHNNEEMYPNIFKELSLLGPGYANIADSLPKTYDTSTKKWIDAKISEQIPALERWKADQEKDKLTAYPAGSMVTSARRLEQGLPAAASVPEKPPTPGSFEDYLAAPPERQSQILAGRKAYGQADDKQPVNIYNGMNQSLPGDWTKTGPEFLETIPQQWRRTVEKVARYDEDPTRVASMRGGMREALMSWVNQVNPGYKEDRFRNRAPTLKAYTTGTQGRQIGAINTAIGHIDQFIDLAKQLETGGFVPANAAYNAIRTMFGSDKVSNFNLLKDALGAEVAGVLSQNGATVSAIADAKKGIGAASSPTALAGYVKTQLPVMGAKLGTMNYQFHQEMDEPDYPYPWDALSPESKRILEKHGIPLTHSDQQNPNVPPPDVKAWLDSQAWAPGKSKKVTGPGGVDLGTWARNSDGSYRRQ